MLLSFAAKDHDLKGPHPGPDSLFVPHLKCIKSGKGVALRKEKAFLHTFAAGQKYVVGRDETRRLCFDLKSKEQQINDLLLSG